MKHARRNATEICFSKYNELIKIFSKRNLVHSRVKWKAQAENGHHVEAHRRQCGTTEQILSPLARAGRSENNNKIFN